MHLGDRHEGIWHSEGAHAHSERRICWGTALQPTSSCSGCGVATLWVPCTLGHSAASPIAALPSVDLDSPPLPAGPTCGMQAALTPLKQLSSRLRGRTSSASELAETPRKEQQGGAAGAEEATATSPWEPLHVAAERRRMAAGQGLSLGPGNQVCRGTSWPGAR